MVMVEAVAVIVVEERMDITLMIWQGSVGPVTVAVDVNPGILDVVCNGLAKTLLPHLVNVYRLL